MDDTQGISTAHGEPSVPEARHVRVEEHTDEREYEATELDHVQPQSQRRSHSVTSSIATTYWPHPIKKFWREHIRVSVPSVTCRDHLANERTFLGYLRSSLMLSVMGVLIAQLYRIQHAPQPSPVFGYYVLSVPLAFIFQASALGMVLLGANRFWRQQSAMVRGKIHAGGWEILLICGYVSLLMIAVFVIHVGVDIYKDVH